MVQGSVNIFNQSLEYIHSQYEQEWGQGVPLAQTTLVIKVQSCFPIDNDSRGRGAE